MGYSDPSPHMTVERARPFGEDPPPPLDPMSRRLDQPEQLPATGADTTPPFELGPDAIAVFEDGLTIVEPGAADPPSAEPTSREHARRGAGFAFAKRAGDLALVLATAVVWVPLYLVLAALVLVVDGRPIHYTEPRVGRDGREFKIVKLRSMRTDHGDAHVDHEAAFDARIDKAPHDPRLTRIGGRLRRSSLDELPQLFNVLLGHMTLVGPRPVTRMEIDRFYGECAGLVLSVRPGLTGLWQVSGRSTLAYEERVALEAEYVRERSLRLDLAILVRTIPTVVSGHGAY